MILGVFKEAHHGFSRAVPLRLLWFGEAAMVALGKGLLAGVSSILNRVCASTF